MKDNPFEIIDPDDPSMRSLRGWLQDGPEQIHDHSRTVATWVTVCHSMSNHGNNPVAVKYPVLWEPEVGTTVQLCEPNRDATVCSVRRVIEPSGELAIIVYLDDPEITGKN